MVSNTDRSGSADVLAPNWCLSCHAAFDMMVINLHNSLFLSEASITLGKAAENKSILIMIYHVTSKGGLYTPLLVKVFGDWGCEAREVFSRKAKKLATQSGCSPSEMLSSLYSRLGLVLMQQNTRAMLARSGNTDLRMYGYMCTMSILTCINIK